MRWLCWALISLGTLERLYCAWCRSFTWLLSRMAAVKMKSCMKVLADMWTHGSKVCVWGCACVFLVLCEGGGFHFLAHPRSAYHVFPAQVPPWWDVDVPAGSHAPYPMDYYARDGGVWSSSHHRPPARSAAAG